MKLHYMGLVLIGLGATGIILGVLGVVVFVTPYQFERFLLFVLFIGAPLIMIGNGLINFQKAEIESKREMLIVKNRNDPESMGILRDREY